MGASCLCFLHGLPREHGACTSVRPCVPVALGRLSCKALSRGMRGNQIADIYQSLVSRWWYDARAGATGKYRPDTPPLLPLRLKTRRCASIPLELCELKDLLPKHMILSKKKRLSLPAPATGPRGGVVGLERAVAHTRHSQALSSKNPAPRTSGGVLVFASPALSFRPALWLGEHTGKEKFQRRRLILDSTECSLPVRRASYTGVGAQLHSTPPREQQRLTLGHRASPPLRGQQMPSPRPWKMIK